MIEMNLGMIYPSRKAQYAFVLCCFLGLVFFTISACNSKEVSLDDEDQLVLVWSEEFDVDGLPNPKYWSYDVGRGCDKPCGCGWGNQELQYYSEANINNSRIENGNLIIEARKESIEGAQFTSARLVTKNKVDFKYGRIDIRAKLPTLLGAWPAIWLLPTDSKIKHWPASGEIDIVEHVGYVPDSIFGTIHTQSYNHLNKTEVGGKIFSQTIDEDFHTYSLRWDKNQLEWFMDGEKFFTFKNENKTYKEWPFDNKFHLILNLAVGGTFGGRGGTDMENWPQQFMIDFVRLYQENENE